MKILSKEEQYHKLVEGSLSKAVISLAIPTTISQLVMIIYNLADTLFVAQISSSAAAAVGVVFSIMALIQAIGFGFGMGCSSIISRQLGANQKEEADRTASSACAAVILIALIFAICSLLSLSTLMRFLGATGDVYPLACSYAFFILLVSPFMCVSFVLNAILRAQGEAMLSMISLCGGGIINAVLDPLFIFTFHMGIRGAAIATAISQIFSFLSLSFFFITKKTIISLNIHSISLKPRTYISIITTGLPTIFRQGLGSVATAALNIQASVYGPSALCAITIAGKMYMLVRNLVIGIGQGFQPVAGYNYGAGKIERVKKAFKITAFAGTIICIVISVIMLLFSRPIMLSFCHNDTLALNYGIQTLKFFCLVIPFLAYSTYVNQLFQCLGFTKQATFLASLRQGIFFLPLIFILPHFLGFLGVQCTQASSDFLTFLISIPFQIHFFKTTLRSENKF